MSDTLRSAVIKLASEKPELRGHLLPLVKVGMEHASLAAFRKYMREHPGASLANHSIADSGKKPAQEGLEESDDSPAKARERAQANPKDGRPSESAEPKGRSRRERGYY